jgi:hypothetical protein
VRPGGGPPPSRASPWTVSLGGGPLEVGMSRVVGMVGPCRAAPDGRAWRRQSYRPGEGCPVGTAGVSSARYPHRMSENGPLVGVIMGSQSDWETMRHASEMLDELGVPCETRVVSAHRTPDLLFEYAEKAAGRGLEVIIAGAGGAAHLPGMVAAKTVVPVWACP